jgi:hypothetical protein
MIRLADSTNRGRASSIGIRKPSYSTVTGAPAKTDQRAPAADDVKQGDLFGDPNWIMPG